MLPILSKPDFTGISEIFNTVNHMFDDFGSKWFDDFSKNGLKRLINRPHNLYTIRDQNGDIEKLTFECVYTPFTKDELSVSIDGDVLNVRCGAENKKTIENQNMLFHGISDQSYQFKLPLDSNIDQDKIEVKAQDGVLKIDMPIKKPEPEPIPESRKLEIK